MKGFIIIVLTGIAFQVQSQTERKYVRRGNREFDENKFQQAEIQYRKALEKNPQYSGADYNLGNALYRQNQFDAAATRYAALADKEKENLALNRQFYNLGNALYKAGKYKESIEAYKNALRKLPGDMDAKHNLQLALKKLEEQNSSNQNQQNQDSGNNQKQNNKNQQNQDSGDGQKQNENQEKPENQQSENRGDDKQKPGNPQPMKGQISPEDAERILQALENEEKNVLKKVQEQQKQVQKVPVDKNW